LGYLTTTPDIRDLDCLYLATIGGCDYYETRQIVKVDNGVRRVVGLASAWPVIQRDARIAELTALLVASERRSVEADCYVVELTARLSAYDELFALHPPAEPPIEPPIESPIEPAAPAARESPDVRLALDRCTDGRIPCDYPGCLDWVKPRGLPIHKRQAHGVSTTGVASTPAPAAPDADSAPPLRRKCPYCTERPKAVGLQAHIARRHPEQTTVIAVPTPTITPIALALGERPWECDHCHESTHARSLAQPTLCIRCVVLTADTILSNGHLAAA
jgi:hypothetical protein